MEPAWFSGHRFSSCTLHVIPLLLFFAIPFPLPAQAALNVHYLGHCEANWGNIWVNGEKSDDHWEVPSQTSFDLQYSYTFERFRKAKLRIGCSNCGGETPPMKVTPTEFAWNGISPYVDMRGRYYYLRWQQPIR